MLGCFLSASLGVSRLLTSSVPSLEIYEQKETQRTHHRVIRGQFACLSPPFRVVLCLFYV